MRRYKTKALLTLPFVVHETLTPECPVNLSTLFFGHVFFCYKGCLVSYYKQCYFIEIPEFNANSVDPDKMPHALSSAFGPQGFILGTLL